MAGKKKQKPKAKPNEDDNATNGAKDLDSNGAITVVRPQKKHWYSITAMTAAYFPYAGFSYAEILRRLQTNNIFYYVALVGGHTAGFVDFEIKPDSAQILGIAVLEEYRDRGIGSKLLAKAVSEIRKISRQRRKTEPTATPISRIDLMVSETNPPALALYRKFGFDLKGKLDHQLWGQDILVFCKKLEKTKTLS